MLTLLKLLRGMIKAITSAAAPWQVALGAFFGVLLGFLPLFSLHYGPSWLGFSILFVALVINCHLGSVLVFMALGKGLALALKGPAAALGDSCSGLARRSADVPFLYHSQWSHTGYLGETLIGFGAAPLVALAMFLFTRWFRAKVAAKLAERKKLVTAGKVMGNTMVFKATCWFLGL